jgi:hypothetical protein
LLADPKKIQYNPARPDELNYVVPSVSKPGLLNYVQIKNSNLKCDCAHYKSIKICSHCVAIAIRVNMLNSFLNYRASQWKDFKPNADQLLNGDLNQNRGNKPHKATQIRKGSSSRNHFQVDKYADE